jgi:hypothetical protein
LAGREWVPAKPARSAREAGIQRGRDHRRIEPTVGEIERMEPAACVRSAVWKNWDGVIEVGKRVRTGRCGPRAAIRDLSAACRNRNAVHVVNSADRWATVLMASSASGCSIERRISGGRLGSKKLANIARYSIVFRFAQAL